MKELYLTVTQLSFVLEGRVLARGRIITSSRQPLAPGAIGEAGEEAPRLGMALPVPGEEIPAGRWSASLEGEPGYSLTLAAGRFAIGRAFGDVRCAVRNESGCAAQLGRAEAPGPGLLQRHEALQFPHKSAFLRPSDMFRERRTR